MQLTKPSQSLEGRAVLYFRPYLKISVLKNAEHDGKYIDTQLNRNFVFLLPYFAGKSNNMLILFIKGAFLAIQLNVTKRA